MDPCSPKCFDLFVKEEKTILVVGTKRGRLEELQDPTIPYDQILKRAYLDSRKFAVVDATRHHEKSMDAYSSNALPPPPPLSVEMSPVRDKYEADA